MALIVLTAALPGISQSLVAQSVRDGAGPAYANSASVSVLSQRPSLAVEGAIRQSDFRQLAPFFTHTSFRTQRGLYQLFGATDDTHSPAASTKVSARPATVEATPSFQVKQTPKRPTRLWYALLVAQHGAAAFDAWTTRSGIHGSQGEELNPLFRPFAHSGAIYAATQVAPVLLDYLGHRMMNSQRSRFRRWWWLPQVAGTAGSLGSGVHNLTAGGN